MAFRLAVALVLAVTVGLIGIQVFSGGSPEGSFYTSPQTTIRIVDEEGTPVKDALVLLNWRVTGPDGLVKRSVQVIEVLTDEKGEARIPAWGPLSKSVGRLGWDQPHLRVFKLGFLPRLQINEPTAGGYKTPDTVQLRWAREPIMLHRADKDDPAYVAKVQTLARSMAFFGSDEDCFILTENRMVSAVNAELDRIQKEHGLYTGRVVPSHSCSELQELGSNGGD